MSPNLLRTLTILRRAMQAYPHAYPRTSFTRRGRYRNTPARYLPRFRMRPTPGQGGLPRPC
jgi:hypothetical protein